MPTRYGSVREQFGTYGWTIATITQDRILQALGNVYGHNPSSFRAELYGLQAMLLVLHLLHRMYEPSEN